MGYTRVSTQEQAREGVSLAAQRSKIEAHAKAQGLLLLDVYSDEGVSGRKASNRPALEAAISRVSEVKGTLIVYSLSRLARSTADAIAIAGRLQRADAQLVMIAEQVDTQTAFGKMFYTVLSALAQFESDQISERVRLAIDHKKARGERYSRMPAYGYRYIGDRIEESEPEQRVLRCLYSLREEGRSYREIAAKFAMDGIRNRKGQVFPFQHLALLARRPERN